MMKYSLAAWAYASDVFFIYANELEREKNWAPSDLCVVLVHFSKSSVARRFYFIQINQKPFFEW